jgi:hypothetical protein
MGREKGIIHHRGTEDTEKIIAKIFEEKGETI